MVPPSPCTLRCLGDPQVTSDPRFVVRSPVCRFSLPENWLWRRLYYVPVSYVISSDVSDGTYPTERPTFATTRVQAISLNHVRPGCPSSGPGTRASTDF